MSTLTRLLRLSGAAGAEAGGRGEGMIGRDDAAAAA